MTLKLNIHALTEAHVGQTEKPNEDFFFTNNINIFALADGISRSLNTDGTYPAKNSVLVPSLLVRNIVTFLSDKEVKGIASKQAFSLANNEIAGTNGMLGITSTTVNFEDLDYFGTTGLSFHVDLSTGKAVFAYIGDPIGIYWPINGQPVLLTRDQLHNLHNFSYGHFKAMETEIGPKEAKRQRLLFQRKDARNRKDATDPAGNLIGYGALTGEPSALNFLEIAEFEVQPGDKFLFASDAMRVIADIPEHEQETIASYAKVLEVIDQNPIEWVPTLLLKITREAEVSKNARSDDATFCIVQIINDQNED